MSWEGVTEAQIEAKIDQMVGNLPQPVSDEKAAEIEAKVRRLYTDPATLINEPAYRSRARNRRTTQTP
ncbi:hypothetical protein [Rhodococcoides yunnanense]|uniref:hypothetical protein n=1 Tax=Rhodococcoides yunnanense TaxID=278209 RepID=UPI000932B2EB|nr:hypothetical protein [Rhodococcus yunnanensis]